MPAVVVVPTKMVIVAEPLPGEPIYDGVTLAVAPAGNPDALKAIAELKPFAIVVVIVAAPETPGTVDSESGDPEIVKSGLPLVGVTFKAKSSSTKDVLSFEFSTAIK